MRALTLLLLCLALSACAGSAPTMPSGPPPPYAGETFAAADGTPLPLRTWLPARRVRAVIVAAHGMNDYGMAFDAPAQAWAAQGIATYAYDQRGFGAAAGRGLWCGGEVLAADMAALARLAAARHPGAPIHLLGESMGAAVAVLAAGRSDLPPLAGLVLSAPAVWPDGGISSVLRGFLAVGAAIAPEAELPPRSLGRPSSDDPAVMAGLRSDPYVQHLTRLDILAGVVDLMALAGERAAAVRAPSLVLFGEDDVQVPRDGVAALVAALPAPTRLALYPHGHHLLMRGSTARWAVADVAAWVGAPEAPLPSLADVRARRCRDRVLEPDAACDDAVQLAELPS